jgi:hypothetical protein
MPLALRRLGYDKTELTVHGLRSTVSTRQNESGEWHADAIERQLATRRRMKSVAPTLMPPSSGRNA